MRIALADDGALFRDGLVLLLEAAGHEVVHCTPDGDALLECVSGDMVDIAVLDVRMPPEPEGGLLTAGRLRAKYPELGLLLLSHYSEAHYLGRILEIGPQRIGYRLKDRLASVAALNDTLNRIADGEIVIEPTLATRLVDHARLQRKEFADLSGQELRVLRLMAAGMSNSGIAEEIGVSRKSVEKQVGTIFAKLPLPGDGTAHHRRVLAVLLYLRTFGDG